MIDKKNKQISRNLFFIGIPMVLALIVIRFVVYYFKTDGFSGLSMLLPAFLIGIFVFALITSSCFAAWVYEDCKVRKDDGVLWAIIVFFTTPFIGLLVYFLRRSEIKQSCPSCQHNISLRAFYCENCGSHIDYKEENEMKKRTHHLKYIVAGVIGMVLMLSCLVGFIINAAVVSGSYNTNISSENKFWNMGVIRMSVETQWNGTWKLKFKSASDGFVKEAKLKIKDNENEILYADIQCETVPEGASLTLWIVQGEMKKSVDVTNLSEPLEYSLSEFDNGRVRVRLQINGVKDVASEIYLK